MEFETEFDVEIDGKPYRLTLNPWPYKDGLAWLARMTCMIGPAATGGGDDVVAEVLKALDEATLLKLADTCCHNTWATRTDGDGGEAVRLSGLTASMKDQYDITLRVMVNHVKARFGPSFASLAVAFGGPDGAGATAPK